VTGADRRRRILWLSKGLGPGGAEQLLVEHARAGDHDAYRYEAAFVLDWKQHLVPRLDALGVRTRSLGVSRELDLRWIDRLHGLLERERYDVVHAHSPSVAVAARAVVRALPHGRRPAFVYTEHNRWPSYRTPTRLANRLTYRWNDAVLAVSRDVRDSISPGLRAGVEVVVHGIDVARVRAAAGARAAMRAELGAGDDEILAVTVANLRAGKNYPGLLEAARRVLDRDVPVRFAAAGQGPLHDEIDALHARLELGDRFRLLGYRDDAVRVIAAADVFVLASHHEGLPVTVMEALTLGVPVVAPAVGGLPEIVTSGVDGLLVTPGSPDALADALASVADPGTRGRLARGAAATGDRFSARHAVDAIERVYATVTTRACG
jgi:glycosyltransferase involved in cell wall biosynthesis